jgi:gamma-glutamyltranspeptidase / glutathione hydrolase
MGLVVCPEVHAAQAGREIFAAGGNAADAAVAAAFVQCVTNPMACGLGGTASIYYFHAKSSDNVIINAESTIGSGAIPADWVNRPHGMRLGASVTFTLSSRANEIGWAAATLPSFVRGCQRLYERFGSRKLSWTELLDPAIRLAKSGFSIPAYSAAMWQYLNLNGTAKDRYSFNDDAAAIYLRPDGLPFQAGDWFVQKALASTLSRLGEKGANDFYDGEIGYLAASDFKEHGGLLTMSDFRSYDVRYDEPLSGRFREFSLAAQPFSNGSQIIELLQILGHFDLVGLGHNSIDYIDLVTRCMRVAFTDQMKAHDPSDTAVERFERVLISSDRASYWAKRIKQGGRAKGSSHRTRRGTTQIIAGDDDGNFAAMNHSIGDGGGSRVVTKGLGFLYNQFMVHFNPEPGQPDFARPGRRMVGGSPLALLKDEKPILVIGSLGGTRIVSSIVQAVINVIDFGMDMRTAVTVPRFHSQQGPELYVDPSLREWTVQGLSNLGHAVARSSYQSCPQAILARIDIGGLEGGSDPRWASTPEIGAYPGYDLTSDPAFIGRETT